jgi:hypothetical protein
MQNLKLDFEPRFNEIRLLNNPVIHLPFLALPPIFDFKLSDNQPSVLTIYYLYSSRLLDSRSRVGIEKYSQIFQDGSSSFTAREHSEKISGATRGANTGGP